MDGGLLPRLLTFLVTRVASNLLIPQHFHRVEFTRTTCRTVTCHKGSRSEDNDYDDVGNRISRLHSQGYRNNLFLLQRNDRIDLCRSTGRQITGDNAHAGEHRADRDHWTHGNAGDAAQTFR